MSKEPEVGGYVYTHTDCGELISNGWIIGVENLDRGEACDLIVKQECGTKVYVTYISKAPYNDYFIPKKLVESKLGQILWNTK